MKENEITFEELHKKFTYFPESGVLINKKTFDLVGKLDANGYLYVRINSKAYFVHRIVYCMYYGYFPKDNIDHINRNPNDNRIDNLRAVSQVINARNTLNSISNKSGVKGVNFYEGDNRWKSYIMYNKKLVHIGYFEFFINAVKARLYAENIFNYTQHTVESPAASLIKEAKKTGIFQEMEKRQKVFSEWRFFCYERKKVLDKLAGLI